MQKLTLILKICSRTIGSVVWPLEQKFVIQAMRSVINISDFFLFPFLKFSFFFSFKQNMSTPITPLNMDHSSSFAASKDSDKYELEKVIDEIEPMLSSAELRLMDAGEHSYENLHLTVKNHINEWRNVVGVVQNKALQIRNTCNRLYVTNKTLEGRSLAFVLEEGRKRTKGRKEGVNTPTNFLKRTVMEFIFFCGQKKKKKGELDEKDHLIKSIQEEMAQMKENYELQLKGLENLLATHGTKFIPVLSSAIHTYTLTHSSHSNFFLYIFMIISSTNKKKNKYNYIHIHIYIIYINNNNVILSNEELEKVRREMEENLRKYQQQQIEQQKLQKSLEILKSENASEMQQILISSNEQLAKKDDELLRLRWTVQVCRCCSLLIKRNTQKAIPKL
ncbi:hypothetical protein RFI_17677 [Reticulomyxa filosa]|uniref:Uncharacterized protein n=1 Tax=Reticulomyxa filosa TaxID=46433 RepID=X6N0W3_RETFI|nr:hypothetical protein RFI_17677 [Reticulomyxa filosa]|eukprot:ETO19553.1 hypothetical protein RFI_17677 [Reticulomyxa filosa]